MRKIKILVVEDTEKTWELYSMVLTQLCNIPLEDITRARWYTETEQKIMSEQYDLVLLDHRMPYDDPSCTDMSNAHLFRIKLRNIGYGLLPLLKEKQPSALIVGTSSFGPYGIEKQYNLPELLLDKFDMFNKLPQIIQLLS